MLVRVSPLVVYEMRWRDKGQISEASSLHTRKRRAEHCRIVCRNSRHSWWSHDFLCTILIHRPFRGGSSQQICGHCSHYADWWRLKHHAHNQWSEVQQVISQYACVTLENIFTVLYNYWKFSIAMYSFKWRFTKISQSRTRPLLGPSHGWKHL